MDLKNYEILFGSGTPISGANVEVYEANDLIPNGGAVIASTTTNANGKWEFTGLSNTPKDVKVTYSGRVRWYKGNTKHSATLVRDSTFSVPNVNLLRNGGLEDWAAGTSFVIGTGPVAVATFWYQTAGAGDSGTTAREGTTKSTDSQYSAKVTYTKSAGNYRLYFDCPAALVYALRGRDIAVSFQIRQGVGNNVRAYVDDGTVTSGSTIGTTGAFGTVSVQRTVSSTASAIKIGIEILASDTVYVDNGLLDLGTVSGTYSPSMFDIGPVSASIIADGSLSTAKYGDRQITAIKIALGTITQAEMGSNSVGTSQLLDGNVTDAKFATPKVNRGGDDVSGTLTFVNNTGIAGRSVAAANANILYVDNSDRVRVGTPSWHMYMEGASLRFNGNIVWHEGTDGPGTGLNADLLDGYQAADLALVGHTHTNLIPGGMIAMWQYDAATIPSGWSDFTDAHDKFIVGARSGGYPAGTTGGATTHVHTVDSHTHTMTHEHSTGSASVTDSDRIYALGDDTRQFTPGHNHGNTGTYSSPTGGATPGTNAGSNIPPYYAMTLMRKN